MRVPEFEYTTQARAQVENDDTAYVRAAVRYERGGNAKPYFSVTGYIYTRTRYPGEPSITVDGRRYWLAACGCVHTEIANAFPELAPYLAWHLVGEDAPMHYIANAIYHWEYWGDRVAGPPWSQKKYAAERTLEQHRQSFIDTCLYGQLPTDTDTSLDTLVEMDKTEITAWLEARLPALQVRFQEVLREVRALEHSLT